MVDTVAEILFTDSIRWLFVTAAAENYPSGSPQAADVMTGLPRQDSRTANRV